MTLNVSNDNVMLLNDQFLDPQFIPRNKKTGFDRTFDFH